jgi:hypothetical protein
MRIKSHGGMILTGKKELGEKPAPLLLCAP